MKTLSEPFLFVLFGSQQKHEYNIINTKQNFIFEILTLSKSSRNLLNPFLSLYAVLLHH